MHVGFDDFVIIHNNHAVADSFQISPKLQRTGSDLRITAYNKFRAVGKGDVLVKFSRGVPEEIIGADRLGNRTGGRRLLFVGNNIAVLEYGHHPFKNQAQSFSAGIHHACLFQNRQKLRRSPQRVGSALADGGPYEHRVLVFLCGRAAFLVGDPGDRKDRALSWLHHRLIGGLHADA